MTPAKPFTSEDDIHRIGLGLLDRSLPKPDWTHAAHFAAALWLMRYRPDINPARDMPGIIRRFNEATGVANTDTGGYHETITQASLQAARSFLMPYPPAVPVYQIMNDLMATPLGHPDWPLAHWSKARLFSPEARRAWVDPDLEELRG